MRIHKPDHARHGREVRVINKSAAFRNQDNEPYIDKNQWIVEEIETKDRYTVSKYILKDEDACPDCDGRNTLHLEDNTHECHDCGETYEVK
tara:strand:- start:535 stop:807 length:273 start_codon:yes stop_codon:yes gene_type:complete